MKRYSVEITHVLRHGPDWTAIIRRPIASSIAIGVGCGRTPHAALTSALHEVRLRRRAGEFR